MAYIGRSRTDKDGYTGVFEVDTNKVTWQGIRWKQLGDFGKRKFENFLVLTVPTERIKVRYL